MNDRRPVLPGDLVFITNYGDVIYMVLGVDDHGRSRVNLMVVSAKHVIASAHRFHKGDPGTLTWEWTDYLSHVGGF